MLKMSFETNCDEFLLTLLSQDEDRIEGFFDKMFGFLYRRTDFFIVREEFHGELGLPPGEAETLVRNMFYKYMEKVTNEKNSVKLEPDEQAQLASMMQIAAEEVCVSNSVPTTLNVSDTVDLKDSSKEAEDIENEFEKRPLVDPECYNGAKFDSYSWSQNLSDVDIVLNVPTNIMSGKQVKVTVKPQEVDAKIFSENTWEKLKQGKFTRRLNIDESTWTLVPGEYIHIYAQKKEPVWWDALFIDDPKIDINKIDASIPYEELDEDSRVKIQELMFNEKQKRLGKPTIQEMKMENILKESWNAEGSPFKGQDYDPSIITALNQS